MNAANAVKAGLWWGWRPARAVRLRRAEAALARYEEERRAGLPARAANAQARFEMQARAAARDWLMV